MSIGEHQKIQERLGVLAATCAARKRLPLRMLRHGESQSVGILSCDYHFVLIYLAIYTVKVLVTPSKNDYTYNNV